MSELEFVSCGERLGFDSEYVAGVGTYVLNHTIRSSVIGCKKIVYSDGKAEIRVITDRPATYLPKTGDIVTAKVTRINARMANVSIISVQGHITREEFPGIIRQRDVRAFEIDDVKIHESFRPNDIIKAKVLSLGDSKAYFLTTADNQLGVILARSSTGHVMVPISWQEMQCTASKKKEKRKVARIETETATASA